MTKPLPLLLVVAAVFVSFFSMGLYAQEASHGQGQPEPPMAGIHWARGVARPHASTSPDLIYHGGPIMPTTVTRAIYWGSSWTDTNAKITGMDTWYAGVSNSAYAGTSDEYTDSSGDKVSSNITYGGHLLDVSAAPKSGTRTSPILAEVCKMVPSPVSNGFYAVYVDSKRGHANFCAWHSAGSCNGTPVQFAFFFNLDGDAGCDPQDNKSGHSQGLAALANVTGHELSEARSDPQLNAWYDSSGAENADKCAWTFGSSLLKFSNGSQWKIQGNWSNAAFDNGQTGYANGGCIDGN